MKNAIMRFFTLVLCFSCSSLAAWGTESSKGQTVRVGYFANVTHAQALIGLANGAFQKSLGDGVKIESFVFNAGPSAVEALFSGSIDFAYLGPSPAINAFIRSKGAAVRIVAGACSGGARLIVRKGSGIKTPSDFHGKKLATPQLGNTQDVAARAWLAKQGLKPKDKGGDVEVLPIKNADQLSLFQRGEIDAAWAPEPWASRLIHEAQGEVFLDEKTLWPKEQFVTTHILASTQFIKAHPDLMKKWIAAHVETTFWINENKPSAMQTLNEQIQKLTGQALAPAVLKEAMANLEITYDPIESSLSRSYADAFALGFLGKDKMSLDGIYDLSFLNDALAGRKDSKAAKLKKDAKGKSK